MCSHGWEGCIGGLGERDGGYDRWVAGYYAFIAHARGNSGTFRLPTNSPYCWEQHHI